MNGITTNLLDFYASPGVMTDPGPYAGMLDGLPGDLAGLCRVVQGLLIHPFVTRLYDVDLTSVQRKEVNIRSVAEMLRLLKSLDDRPLTEARPKDERIVGNCRDHAVLFCALLRHQGVPCRVRVGFAAYFGPRLKYDHWVAEVWDVSRARWVMVDPQIDETQRKANGILFDTLDLPDDQFYTAGQAWQRCRSGEARSGDFGHNSKLRGWPYLRGSLLQELAALNKVEVLPWDVWWELGTVKEDTLTPEDRATLDRLAALTTGGDETFPDLIAAYQEDSRFYMPVQSKLRLLGLLGDFPSAAGPAMRPGDGDRLKLIAVRHPGSSGSAAFPPAMQQAGSTDPHLPGFLEPELPPVSSPITAALPEAHHHGSLDPASIIVRGAQQHNLKHIDVTIPRYQLVVLTGVSGSGKSSLAFDTLYAEGQRRYVESLSSYVRRYLEQMDKPKVDFIGGLSPAIAIEQKGISKNPRSTVGTVTEVLDYLRVLYSRVGKQHCPGCGRSLEPLSPAQIAERLGALPAGRRFELLAPILREYKGDVLTALKHACKEGFARARVNGGEIHLDSLPGPSFFDKSGRHTVEIVVDRLQIPDPADTETGADLEREFSVRLIDSVETSLIAGKGRILVEMEDGERLLLTGQNTCPYCEISLPSLTSSLFSFNAPSGMCPECNGLGVRLEVDLDLIVEHPELSILDGASRWYGNIRKKKGSKYWLGNLESMARHYDVDLELPWQELPQRFRDVVLWGSGDEKIHFSYENENAESSWQVESMRAVKGIVFHINRLFRQTKSDYARRWYTSFMSKQPCAVCGGARLCAEARYVTVGGLTFPQVTSMTIQEAAAWVRDLLDPVSGLEPEQLEIVGEVLEELHNRLQFMLNVGLHYLSLDRPAPTLSGGEGQRIRLASQIGSGLVGVLYILDEPSIGLHARDQRRLLDTLLRLRDMGNTVLVVEHDPETMRAADWIIDLGPGAGVKGGELVAAGTPAQVAANPRSLTGRYLNGDLRVSTANPARRQPAGWLVVHGARLFNLKNIDARFPLGVMTCVTGVSGSGKSSLVAETLYPALMRALHGSHATPGPHDRLSGLEQLDKVINITQDPIGRTPRSNPATYVKVFDDIRRLFAGVPEARMRGYKPDRFSFNVKGGRCETCKGHGQKKIEMHFLADVWVTCQECKGARYNRHTLEIHYKGKSIADVLDMDVQEALEFFANHPAIARSLRTLHDVGLDYVKLGQSATTLSGGEAQRIKLARELSKVATGRTLYILDEPTTGLHPVDIQRLLDVLDRLTEAGNTVVIIEHNLDVIKNVDWILDLGPEGGEAGGMIVAEGPPEQLAKVQASYTGRYLRPVLEAGGFPKPAL